MKLVKLKDVCEFINGDRGKNYPKSNEFVDSEIPFINAGHIKESRIDFSKMNYISEEVFEKLGSGKIQTGDVLFCLRGSLGKNAIINFDKGAIASSLVILRNKNKSRLNTAYLMFVLNSQIIFSQIYRANNGSSQPNLSAKSVKEFVIPLPDIEYQKKVVKVLDLAQGSINKRKAQIKALDQLTQSVFLEMFGDPITNSKCYPIVTLKKLINKIDKINLKESEEIINYIDIASIDNEKNEITSYSEYLGKNAPSRAKQIVNKGDILISTVRPNLKNIAMVEKDLENLICSTGFCVLRSNEALNKDFIFQLVKTDQFTRDLVKLTTGANYPAVKNSDIFNKNIIYPPLELQKKFSSIVREIYQQKYNIENSLHKQKDLFNSLLQRAFKGELFTNEKVSNL